ncbi:hypothetical protein PILCRDRAFT_761201 [Piloderma croceum F 1598]|uniref:Uncharacterized protein n=1 Tax=Piloderma croceum (strain F 1598) TaxID=765440 RepID=A0A0C3G6K2_PILCF|nr:hypothetical protein PILCRDRAFT_761201 [Piloderma croceum F 1598]
MHHKETIRKSTTLRVVSLPDLNHLPSSPLFTGSNSSSDIVDASIFMDHSVFVGDEQFSRIRVRPVDEPHTPSPPSSPDSILIIEDNHQLADTFLRSNPDQNSQRLFSDDEGWITWATSPPRPIPALHGPLSLPYARCPSGAEGTIIEGHDNLPRMIWGLGSDDAPSTHSRVGSHNPHNTNSHGSHLKASSRMQKKQASPAYLATPLQTPKPPPNLRDYSVTLCERDRRTQVATRQHALENLGTRPRDAYGSAVILDKMLQQGAANVAGTWDSLYGNSAFKSQGLTVGDERAFDMISNIALDWQSLLGQPSLRSSVDAKRQEHESKPTHFLKPSAPVFVPSSQVVSSRFPRIFLEPRPTQSPKERNQPRSIPVIETALQYRHHHKTHQNGLPTPPSSSSPQWSSKFSPYQGSLHSPDMAPLRPNRIPNLSSVDSSNELRRFVYEHISSGAPNTTKCLPSDSPKISHAVMSPRALTCSSNVSGKPQHMQHLDEHTVNSVSSPYPGPPPSTPLPPLPAIRDSQSGLGRSPFSTTPPSPTSPEPRPRSFSYQHPRSIPLARLVQRRLSSVPEEDLSTVVDRHSSPQLQSSSQPRNQSYVPRVKTVPQTQQHQQPFHSATIRTPSPIPPVLALRSRTGPEFDQGEFRVEPGLTPMSGSFSVKVRLPYTPLKAVHVEQTKGDNDDKLPRRSEDSKENLIRAQVRSQGVNLRKKGHGKKKRIASRMQIRTPVEDDGSLPAKV